MDVHNLLTITVLVHMLLLELYNHVRSLINILTSLILLRKVFNKFPTKAYHCSYVHVAIDITLDSKLISYVLGLKLVNNK